MDIDLNLILAVFAVIVTYILRVELRPHWTAYIGCWAFCFTALHMGCFYMGWV